MVKLICSATVKMEPLQFGKQEPGNVYEHCEATSKSVVLLVYLLFVTMEHYKLYSFLILNSRTRTVKSLGMTIDNTLSFDDHINNVCKAAHFHIRALRHICCAMSVDDAKMVASAIVSSRLDYCNSILYCTSLSNLNKL